MADEVTSQAGAHGVETDGVQAGVPAREPAPLVAYVSFPFELQSPRCGVGQPYVADHAAKLAYVGALERELASLDEETCARPVAAVRLGGGASVANADATSAFVRHLRDRLCVGPHAEVALEANPLTVCTPSLTDWTGCGVNRVILDVRSVHDDELTALGMPHTRQDVQNALSYLAMFHLTRVDARLSYGIPGQTGRSWQKTLLTMADMGVAHVTALPLPATGGAAAPADADAPSRQALAAQAREVLGTHGYREYALGRFVRTDAPHAVDRFDAAVRAGAGQLGMGAGAVSVLDGFTYRTTGDFDAYVRDAGDFARTTVSPCATDAAFVQARLAQGMLDALAPFSLADLARAAGLSGADRLDAQVTARLAALVADGTCARDEAGRLSYADRGRLDRLAALGAEEIL